MQDLSLVGEAVKAAPPLTVVSVTVLGFSLQEWVYLTTIIYTLLQIAIIVGPKVKEYYGKVRKDRSN